MFACVSGLGDPEPVYVRTAHRPSLHDMYQRMAKLVSERSTCPRNQCGAVVVLGGHVLSTGYNGAPPGVKHCEEVGCTLMEGHCVRSTHAELNAILQAAKLGIALAYSTIYCTHRPCVHCVRAIAQAGIMYIIYEDEYDTDGRPGFIDEVLAVSRVTMTRRA